MPLIDSDTEEATDNNFRELRRGGQFKKTAKKVGKKRAQKQMVAIVLKNKRKAAAKRSARKKG